MPNDTAFARLASGPMRLGALLFVVAAFGAAPRLALAADPAAAEALFKEGRRLFKEGKYDEACPKLAESQRLDPSPGTALNLAACHEQQGKLASAWAEFLAASRLARARGEGARAGEAARRASLLEPKLSTLVVRARGAAPGMVIKRNGETIEAAQIGTRLPVDPGEYVVTAEAPGRAPFRQSVVVKPDADNASVEVPPLSPESSETAARPSPPSAPPPATAPPPGAAPPEAEAARGAPGRPLVGYVVGGAGLAALGVGAAFGVMALSSYSKADEGCPEHDQCPQGAIDDRDRAVTQAWIANAGIGVGLVGVAVGGYLLFFSRPSPKASGGAGALRTGVVLAPQPGGLTLQGRF
jgi:hypothetical protein